MHGIRALEPVWVSNFLGVKMPESLEDLKTRREKLKTIANPVDVPKPYLDPAIKEAIEEEYRAQWWEAFRKQKPLPETPAELLEFPEWQLNSKPWTQPEHNSGSDPATFKVGQWYQDPNAELHARVNQKYNPWIFREALPETHYPNPGAPCTNEIKYAWLNRQGVVDKANHFLEQIIRWRAEELHNPAAKDSRADKNTLPEWHWLSGTWAARGLKIPTDEQIDGWAREKMESLWPSKPADPQGNTPSPAASNSVSAQPQKWDGVVRNCPR
jgi:hypothetical protein